jgi:ABC-type transporter Mla MlaB component
VIRRSVTVHAQIRGPLGRDDLPGLYARMCAQLEGARGGTLVCDVGGVRVDAVVVEAVARLVLAARRHGCRLLIANAPASLDELIHLCGLDEVIVAA